MALPIREQLLAFVTASVAAINPGNGYVTTVAEAGRLKSSPLIAQMRFPNTVVHQANDVAVPDAERLNQFHCRVLGIVVEHWRNEATKGAISTELESAHADHLRAVLGPDGLGRQGTLAERTDWEESATLLSEKNVGMGGFLIRFNARYRHQLNDPTAG